MLKYTHLQCFFILNASNQTYIKWFLFGQKTNSQLNQLLCKIYYLVTPEAYLFVLSFAQISVCVSPVFDILSKDIEIINYEVDFLLINRKFAFYILLHSINSLATLFFQFMCFIICKMKDKSYLFFIEWLTCNFEC